MGDSPHILGANTVWIIVIFAWTMGMMLPFFWILNKFNLLRISPEEEMVCRALLHATHVAVMHVLHLPEWLCCYVNLMYDVATHEHADQATPAVQAVYGTE